MKKIIIGILLFVVFSCNSSEPTKVAWSDDINNIENNDFLIETLFNLENPGLMSDEEIQFHFIERYYTTCSDTSIQWYNEKYSLYGFNPD